MSLPAAFYDHVGIVTNDTVRTAELWSALLGIQVPATFNNAGPAGNLSHNGVHTDANILGAYIGCNALAGLEILQPTDTFSSAWLDQLRLFGTSPYYLGFASDTWTEADLAAKQATFTAVGCPAVQAGYWWNSPGHRGCYRYMACQSTAFGAPIEVMTRNNCVMEPPRHESRPPAAARAAGRGARGVGTPARARQPRGAALECSRMSHVGVVVPNASATVAAFARAFGGTKPALRRVSSAAYRHRNTTASAWWAELPLHGESFALRVFQPTGPVGSATVLAPPSWWHDGLQRFGPSVHLLGFIVDDVEEATRRLASHGIDVLQRGPCYAYLDSLDALGLVVEVQAEGCAE